MPSLKFHRACLCATLLLTGVIASSMSIHAQGEGPAQGSARVKADDVIGLEVQLHLLVGSKTATADDEKPPASLDGVLKQLRATFAFKHYRLATTLLNRVKNGGRLSLRWVGGPLLASSAATTATPGFNEFRVNTVKLIQDDAGSVAIQMLEFNFGARIPIQVPSIASNGTTIPVVQYEQTGIQTDITVHEGEPTIVGTLNVGPASDALIIVVTAKRPSPNR